MGDDDRALKGDATVVAVAESVRRKKPPPTILSLPPLIRQATSTWDVIRAQKLKGGEHQSNKSRLYRRFTLGSVGRNPHPCVVLAIPR